MSCAQVSLLGSRNAKRRVCAATLMRALLLDEVDHPVLGMSWAEVSLLGSRYIRQTTLVLGPSFGVAGTKKRECCAGHAKDVHVDHSKTKCTHSGCSKRPSFGVAGTKTREPCREHAKDGMVDLQNTKKKIDPPTPTSTTKCDLSSSRTQTPRPPS